MNKITFPLFAFLFFSKILAAQADTVPSFFQFVGVKIGDVDFSADPGQ